MKSSERKFHIGEIKPKIGFIGSTRQSILEDLNFAAKNGFDYYEIQAVKEITGEKDFNLDSKVINRVKKIAKENNIYLNLHISRFNSICSINPEFSKRDLLLVKKEIILAKEIGVRQITIHSGYKDILNDDTAIAKNFEILTKNFKEIMKLGRKHRIKIGLENSFGLDKLCRTPEDLLKVVNSIEGLGITFDIGHANIVNLNPIEYFRKVKNFVINIHLHDNDGTTDQHALLGKGNINFKKFLKECKNSNYHGPFILEVFPRENVLEGKEILLNLWNRI